MKPWPIVKSIISIAAVGYTVLSVSLQLASKPKDAVAQPPAALPVAVAQPAMPKATPTPNPNQVKPEDLKVIKRTHTGLTILAFCVQSEQPLTILKVTINNEFSPTRTLGGSNAFGDFIESDDEYRPTAQPMGAYVTFIVRGDQSDYPTTVKRAGPNYDKSVVKVEVQTDRGTVVYKL